MNNDRPISEAPSDLELMMYFDGELEEPRRSVVAAFVGADLRARNKLSGLRIASALVQNEPRSLAAADNIADLVLAKIAAEAASPAVVPVQRPAASAMPQAPVIPFQQQPLVAPPRPAANDNGRRILVGLTALVAAAAAVIAVWSRMPDGPSGSSGRAPVAVQSSPSPSPVAIEAKSVPSPEIDAAVVSPEADSEHGVEVASVKFGSHMGSIFYVPSGSIEAKRTTTVVWLADDAGE